MLPTMPLLKDSDFPPLIRERLQTLQVNLGYLCNQQCLHCHVNAGPRRKEIMDQKTVNQVIAFMQRSGVTTLDLTGGAPEMNPHFRQLVEVARESGVHVIDRCNLTVLLEPEQFATAEFLAAHRVEIVASLPCYSRDNVDQQRGKGVFADSIRVLRRLNQLGYGDADGQRPLNLVYNPQGPQLPPPQPALEADYKQRLMADFGIRFNGLYTLANMPIQRFGSMLISKGEFSPYMDLLKSSARNENLSTVMCRSLISVDWQGYVYDCDFNQMLKMPAPLSALGKTHISMLSDGAIQGRPIAVADHCYACIAGQGSSCGGALV